MKILIAPLNWGLGHASRCLPIIVRHLRQGDDVVLAGDGESLLLLRQHFPGLRYYDLAPLALRYGSGKSQVWAMIRALPTLCRFVRHDQMALIQILEQESFDMIISDNRFGLYIPSAFRPFFSQTRCVYMTHQLVVRMPSGLRWLEPLGHWLHQRLIHHYDECWIPDYAGSPNLAGDLAHRYPTHEAEGRDMSTHSASHSDSRSASHLDSYLSSHSASHSASRSDSHLSSYSASHSVSHSDSHLSSHSDSRSVSHHVLTRFIGPLSRFEYVTPKPMEKVYDTVAVLSGLEPQRTLFEQQLKAEYAHSDRSVLLIRGKMGEPMMQMSYHNMTIVPRMDDGELAWYLLHANTIIMRSGYSSIMDLAVLGLLDKEKRGELCIRLVATPGQTEQEYLAALHSAHP